MPLPSQEIAGNGQALLTTWHANPLGMTEIHTLSAVPPARTHAGDQNQGRDATPTVVNIMDEENVWAETQEVATKVAATHGRATPSSSPAPATLDSSIDTLEVPATPPHLMDGANVWTIVYKDEVDGGEGDNAVFFQTRKERARRERSGVQTGYCPSHKHWLDVTQEPGWAIIDTAPCTPPTQAAFNTALSGQARPAGMTTSYHSDLIQLSGRPDIWADLHAINDALAECDIGGEFAHDRASDTRLAELTKVRKAMESKELIGRFFSRGFHAIHPPKDRRDASPTSSFF